MDRKDWDSRYSTDELVWKAEPNRFLAEEARQLEPGRALDLACGEGRNALWLASQGWQVTAVDFSSVGLAKAEHLASVQGLNVEFVNADLLDWAPPPTTFDFVLVAYLHLPPPARQHVLAGVTRALAPGGTALVVGHDIANLKEGVGGPQDPTVLFCPEGIAAELEGLEIERAERVLRPVASEEGPRNAVDALVRARRPS